MTDIDIRNLQIIYFAQILGASFFAAIVLYLYLTYSIQTTGPSPENIKLIQLLTLVLIALSSIVYFSADIIFKRILAIPSGPQLSTPVLFSRIRTAFVVRIALFEGAAFFSLAVLMLGVITGVIQHKPVYWLVAFPYIFLVWFALWNFPSKDSLQELLTKMTGGSFA